MGYGDFLPETENQRVFTTFYVCVGFALLCVIGVTAGDVFHNAVRSSDQSVHSKRVLDMLKEARLASPNPIAVNSGEGGDENSERGTTESRDSSHSHIPDSGTKRKVPSRRLSMMNKNTQGDIFPSPYSIKDPRMLQLMREINMDMFDEELEVHS